MSKAMLFAAGSRKGLLKGLARSRHVVLVGLGNIGSRLAVELPLVGAKELLFVDPDYASTRNLGTCWAFAPEDIGQPKVEVLARQIRKAFPSVSVTAMSCPFDLLGLARLRDWSPAILVGAVDSRRARYELAEAALWLGMPLVDLGIPVAGPPAAKARITWWPMRAIDTLDAWSARDWDLLEQAQPCRSGPSDQDDRPVASSVSGAAAASLGLAAVRKLLSGDVSDVGWECRLELTRFTAARHALPSEGFSPLDPMDTIRDRPVTRRVATLGDLVRAAERLLGSGAVLLLNREISFGFLCRHCGQRPDVGPIGRQCCPKCGQGMNPIHPLSRLSRDFLEDRTDESVVCLGVPRDLLRARGRTERDRIWIEYVQEAP